MYGYKGPRSLFRRFEILRYVTKLPRDWRVLDIGAGALGLAVDLAQHFSHVTAMDLSENIYTYAKGIPDHLHNKIRVLNGDFLTSSLDETFDVIVACEVLEHIDQEQTFVERMGTYLNPGGCLIISVPAHMKYWSKHDELVGHLRRYSRSDLEEVARWIKPSEYQIIAYGYPWVNLLRLIRVQTAERLLKEHLDLAAEERTIRSGQLDPTLNHINLIFNTCIIWPFALLSTVFNSRNLSEAYLLFARKVSS
jgi:SAM-dependent methyltransferase